MQICYSSSVIQLSSIIGSLPPSAASAMRVSHTQVAAAQQCFHHHHHQSVVSEATYIILDYPPQTKRLIFARFYPLLDQIYISNLFIIHKRRKTPKPQKYLIQQVFLLPNHKVNNFHFYFAPKRDNRHRNRRTKHKYQEITKITTKIQIN